MLREFFAKRSEKKIKHESLENEINVLVKELEVLEKRRVNIRCEDHVSLDKLIALAKQRLNVRTNDVVVVAGSHYEAHGYGYGSGSEWFYLTTKHQIRKERKLEKDIDKLVEQQTSL